MLAADIMSKPVITASPAEDLEAAVRRMLEHDIGCLAVVADDGRLAGILTEADFHVKEGHAPFSFFAMPRLFGRYIDFDGMERIYAEARRTPVSAVMQPKPFALGESATVEEVARLMLDRRIHHVPIVRDGRAIGVVTRRDLMRVLLRA